MEKKNLSKNYFSKIKLKRGKKHPEKGKWFICAAKIIDKGIKLA